MRLCETGAKRTHTNARTHAHSSSAPSAGRRRCHANEATRTTPMWCYCCCWSIAMLSAKHAGRPFCDEEFKHPHTHTHAHVSSRLPAVHLQICTQWPWFRSHRQHVYVARARHAFRNMRHAYLRGCTRVCVGKRRDIATACLVKTFSGCQSTHTHTHTPVCSFNHSHRHRHRNRLSHMGAMRKCARSSRSSHGRSHFFCKHI